MARNDGIDRIGVRNANLTAGKIGNAQRHNEREKDSYVNPDIVPELACRNVYFKKPTASYAETFAQMESNGVISTRGLKPDANIYGEMIFDVNSVYFFNHGGYDFAKRFYADAYKAAVEIVGGEQYILSGVMHADERNTALSEKLGQGVFHYHLHVVYIPVVEKQILWSKRCKDPALVGTVKESIMQVSSSKKWASSPALDENGQPMRSKTGKVILQKSYSVLQDKVYSHMRSAGYTDVNRGECGSSEKNLTVTAFKCKQEKERLEEVTKQAAEKTQLLTSINQQLTQSKQTLRDIRKQTKLREKIAATYAEIDAMGVDKRFTDSVMFTRQQALSLKALAREGITSRSTIYALTSGLDSASKTFLFGKIGMTHCKSRQEIISQPCAKRQTR